MPLFNLSLPHDEQYPPGDDLSFSQMQQAVTAAGVGMWDWDQVAQRLTWSKQEKTLFGLPPDAVMSYERFLACIHLDDRERIDQFNQRVLAEKQARDTLYECRVIWPDGSVHWLTNRGQVIYDECGEIVHVMGVTMDITEMKQEEEALRQNRDEVHLIADASPNIIVIFGRDGSPEYANRRWYDYTGCMTERMEEVNWLSFYHPDDQKKMLAIYQSLPACQSVKTEARLREGKTGAYRWFSFQVFPLKNASGHLWKWMSVCLDIHEKKRSEEALQESETRLHRLIQSNIIGFVISDTTGAIHEANDAFLSLLGYTREDLKAGHLDWRRLTPPEYQARSDEALEEEQVTGAFMPFEKAYLAKDGKCVPALVGGAILHQGSPEQKELCFVMDLTAAKAVERQKDLFLGMTGHELKTPLAALRGTLQLVQRRMKRVSAIDDHRFPEMSAFLVRLGQSLADSIRQVDVQTRLINDLQDVSRIAANKLELSLDRCELNSLVRQTVEDLRVVFPTRSLHLELLENVTIPVMADWGRICQVLTNYVTNAVRYSSPEQPVWIGLTLQENVVRVWVRDRGPGLSEEAQKDIWQSFHQIEGIRVQSGSGKGLGLGLHICQRLIARHQGEVGVESVPGKGSTFWFTLPVLVDGRFSHVKSPKDLLDL